MRGRRLETETISVSEPGKPKPETASASTDVPRDSEEWISRNLRKAYEGVLEEKVPDKLMDLLDQLSKKEQGPK